MIKKKYILDYRNFTTLIDAQRDAFIDSLGVPLIDDKLSLQYIDRNYKCMPYLKNALNSKIQGLSFFSGGGGLDIGAQMAGIKVLTSLDFEKDAIATLKANKFFAHTQHRLDDIRNVKATDYTGVLKKNNPE